MRLAVLLMIGATACGSSVPKQSRAEQLSMLTVTPVSLKASDGLTIFGRYYRAEHPKALILLFHQAGSSKDEYASIAPHLVDMGYSALAIDQRVGGAMFGVNQTAAQLTKPAGFGEAFYDLEGALAWAVPMRIPVIVWGSSYSSALVFQLAASHPGTIAALLSFSPGEYLGSGQPVADAAAKVTVPVFVTSASDPAEIAAAKSIFDAVRDSHKTRYVPANGVHGSSTLIVARNPAGAEASWAATRQFLDGVVRAHSP